MKYSMKNLVRVAITLIVIIFILFIGVISFFLPSFDIKIIGTVLGFSFAIIGICTSFILLVTNHVNTTLDSLSQTIESIIDDNPQDIFSTIEDTMLSKLQSQIIKLSDILKSYNIKQKKEKDDITVLISDISHQLKTPLANLNMYNSLLLDKKLDDNKRMEFTKNMESQVEKLNWLMESLIKMSRLETGIIKLYTQNQSILQTVLQSILAISAKAEEKGINITLNGDDVNLIHDSKWVQEAIFNILDNAVKYSLENTEMDILITKYDLFCRIDIADRGEGIIASDINKVFTRFYRGENARDKEGVGIGLFLSRKIISEHGGYIKLKSIPGEGTMFSIFLPTTKV